ncbi:MAG: hypothetical protein V4564_00580 [Pseudomonadota bacterium]
MSETNEAQENELNPAAPPEDELEEFAVENGVEGEADEDEDEEEIGAEEEGDEIEG